MAGKICPILSAGRADVAERQCIGNDCMMFEESQAGGACTFIKSPRALGQRIDTLSAQLQEMQVAILKLTQA